jgi:hypothetical protein
VEFDEQAARVNLQAMQPGVDVLKVSA